VSCKIDAQIEQVCDDECDVSIDENPLHNEPTHALLVLRHSLVHSGPDGVGDHVEEVHEGYSPYLRGDEAGFTLVMEAVSLEVTQELEALGIGTTLLGNEDIF